MRDGVPVIRQECRHNGTCGQPTAHDGIPFIMCSDLWFGLTLNSAKGTVGMCATGLLGMLVVTVLT